jgi:hypothetical protein
MFVPTKEVSLLVAIANAVTAQKGLVTAYNCGAQLQAFQPQHVSVRFTRVSWTGGNRVLTHDG